MIAYRATLDVPRELAWFAAKMLLEERRRRGTPRGSRAPSCFWQAVPGLRWFRDRTSAEALARDHGISRATAYRYVDEVVTALAGRAPDLHEALKRARDGRFSHVILDGTVIVCDRCKEPAVSVEGKVIDLPCVVEYAWEAGRVELGLQVADEKGPGTPPVPTTSVESGRSSSALVCSPRIWSRVASRAGRQRRWEASSPSHWRGPSDAIRQARESP